MQIKLSKENTGEIFENLSAPQRKFDKALKYLTAYVHYRSQMKVSEHTETSVGLFLMDGVFLE
jgi:hypothetical protein